MSENAFMVISESTNDAEQLDKSGINASTLKVGQSPYNFTSFNQNFDSIKMTDICIENNQTTSNNCSSPKISHQVKGKIQDKNKQDRCRSIFFLQDSTKGKDLFTSYNTYSICYRNSSGDISFKCKERRYADFDSFRKILKHFYPHIPIPILPPKVFYSKVINNEEFNATRKIGLSYFLNELASNPIISDCTLFNKFINDQKYDEVFFNIENLRSQINFSDTHPLPILNSDSLSSWTSYTNYLPSFGGTGNKERHIDEKEKCIQDHLKEINEKSVQFVDIITNVKTIVNTIQTEERQNSELSLHFQYLRDYNMTDDNYKKYGNLFAQLTSNAENTKKELNSLKLDIIESFDNYNYKIEGLKEVFSIYNDVVNLFIEVDKNSISSYSSNKIKDDKEKMKFYKASFEDKFIQQIQSFILEMNDILPKLINEIGLLLKKYFIPASDPDSD